GTLKESDIANIGSIADGNTPGRSNDEEIFFYSIAGMPVEDVAWATDVYHQASDKKAGTPLNPWDIPAPSLPARNQHTHNHTRRREFTVGLRASAAQVVIGFVQAEVVRHLDSRFSGIVGAEHALTVSARLLSEEAAIAGFAVEGSSIPGFATVDKSDMIF